MTNEELAREFEKAAKSLSKMTGRELLFEEDVTEGRSAIVYAAVNDNASEIARIASEIAAMEEGARHLVRALNNIKTIGHNGMLLFAKSIVDALDQSNAWDKTARLQKIEQLLKAVNENLRDGLGWLDDVCIRLLENGELSHDEAFALWNLWCSATVRACAVATSLIADVGTHRPKNLSKDEIHTLRDAAANEDPQNWDTASAALYLMLGNGLISLDKARDFVERAYVQFPIESLEGVELLALAVEHDAAMLAEDDEIQKKLAKLSDGPALRSLSRDELADGIAAVIGKMSEMPDSAYKIAQTLADESPVRRLIIAAFIDDTRRNDLLRQICKLDLIRDFAARFFAHFVPDHALLREFSSALVPALLENCNVDALLAQNWLDACDSENIAQLQADLKQWQTLFH